MGGGTELGRVRGLGVGGEATDHWIVQRLTALGNLTLMAWLIVSLVRLPAADAETMTQWLRSPFAAVPLMLLVVSVFRHIKLGLQVLIEDYVHDHALRALALVAVTFYAIAGGAFALFCILKIALSSGAA